MDRTIMVGVMVALLLVGAVFVSAQLPTSNAVEDNAPETTQPICGPGTCSGQCGRSCGIPDCGCGR
ncbi:hypothetical protein GF343_05020 [Candidatus Woesearchaeota archaeon]|nr:hypothetical protein [Candidatus Woesearchaeota archaeon]